MVGTGNVNVFRQSLQSGCRHNSDRKYLAIDQLRLIHVMVVRQTDLCVDVGLNVSSPHSVRTS